MRITTDTKISLAKPTAGQIDLVADARFPRETKYWDKAYGRKLPGFTEAVISWFGDHWMCYHTEDSRGSGYGFPDLVCVHLSGITLYAELKTERGVVKPEQATWLYRLALKNKRVYLWRPSDEREILDLIQAIHDWRTTQ